MDIDTPKSSEINPNSPRDYRCAPSKKFNDGSCISLDILIHMAEIYNESNKNKIILSSKLETLNPKKYKRYLVKEFSQRLDDICDNQRCWIKQDFVKRMDKKIKNDLSKNTYRPKGTQGRFDWLSTTNIDQVIKQYEDKYQDFKFLGTVPIDFDDLPGLGIKNLNFMDLINNNKTKIGIVFNLDEHHKSGSHWVSMYSDLKKGNVYFFDSYGLKPEKRIRKFMRRVTRFIENDLTNKNVDVRHNKNRHQYKNSECGVYSINFIVRQLNGETFDDITSNKILDNKMNKCREVYFT